MEFKGDIIITDPCYIMRAKHHGTTPLHKDDWDYCNFGESMNKLGFTTWITEFTLYGDWSCTTYEKGTKKVLGRFCADAGLVSVFLLEEVLKYNPDFDWHINPNFDHTTTLIKDFDGEIYTKVSNWDELSVIGKGNINFFTKQTGL